MAKRKAKQLDLGDELKDILAEYSQELYESKEQALDKASDYFVDKISRATPVRTGETAKSWTRTTKYKGVRYVGNTELNKRRIPVVNLLEFGSKGKPFVRKTFEQNKEQLYKIIKGELENGR